MKINLCVHGDIVFTNDSCCTTWCQPPIPELKLSLSRHGAQNFFSPSLNQNNTARQVHMSYVYSGLGSTFCNNPKTPNWAHDWLWYYTGQYRRSGISGVYSVPWTLRKIKLKKCIVAVPGYLLYSACFQFSAGFSAGSPCHYQDVVWCYY